MPALDTHAHAVQFYNSDEFLVSSVRDHIAPALQSGDAAVVVATKEHRDALVSLLAEMGVEIVALSRSDRFLTIDAEELLSRFMVDHLPDPNRFNEEVGALLTRAASGGRRVKVFGEMVAVLWEQGNVAAALALEDLWNELANTHPFSLLCAYRMSSFQSDGTTEAFEAVCAGHSRVLPTEDFGTVRSEDERLRALATAQHRLEVGGREAEALRRKQKELEDALVRVQDLDRTRGEFVAMVVHDIRSPATVVEGLLGVLRDRWDALSDDQVRDLLSKSIESTRQVQRLVTDVLTVARLDSGEFTFDLRPFDLSEVIEGAVSVFATALSNHRIHVEIQPDLPRAYGDRGRQVQILTNLISNATKFSERGTTISVAAFVHENEIVVSVRDQGPGIAHHDIPKLFQRFSRLERSGQSVKGTGLGLFICRSLVEGQGGRIWVESEPGAGSTFSYTVPAAR